MDTRDQSRKKKSVRERAQEVQFLKLLQGDLIRAKNLTDPVEINKYLADAEAGDVLKYSPVGFMRTGIRVRDPFNSPITPQNKCHFCDYKPHGAKTTLLRCSACKAVKYCDRECQSKDWKFHKKGCALIRSDPKGLGDKLIASTSEA